MTPGDLRPRKKPLTPAAARARSIIAQHSKVGSVLKRRKDILKPIEELLEAKAKNESPIESYTRWGLKML
jgi:hypothetical protein